MFEKEAEKKGNEKIKENNQLARCARKSYKEGFKDGAEFGYNKAKEELEKENAELKDKLEMLSILPKENITEEAEQFIRGLI